MHRLRGLCVGMSLQNLLIERPRPGPGRGRLGCLSRGGCLGAVVLPGPQKSALRAGPVFVDVGVHRRASGCDGTLVFTAVCGNGVPHLA